MSAKQNKDPDKWPKSLKELENSGQKVFIPELIDLNNGRYETRCFVKCKQIQGFEKKKTKLMNYSRIRNDVPLQNYS